MRDYITLILFAICWNSFSQNTNTQDTIKKPSAVPIAIVERAPIFEGCAESPNKMRCFDSKARRFVGKHFDANRAKCLEHVVTYDRKLKKDVEVCKKELKSVRVRIKTTFVIDTLGYATDIKALSPYPTMNEEAIRVIKKLPRFEPGMQRGRKVRVRFSLPIMFNIL